MAEPSGAWGRLRPRLTGHPLVRHWPFILIVLYFLCASLTPNSERVRISFELYDPAHPERRTSDPGHVWDLPRDGLVIRRGPGIYNIVGWFLETAPGDAEFVATWRTVDKKGLVLAPHLTDSALFRIHIGPTRKTVRTAYVKRWRTVDEAER